MALLSAGSRRISDRRAGSVFPSKQNRPDLALRTFLTASFLFSFEAKIESEALHEYVQAVS